jgi:predicted amidohydrolase
MQVVLCQMAIEWENPAANCARVEAMLAAQPPARGALLVLPEMFATGFSMNPGAIPAERQRDVEGFLTETAQRHGVCIVAGVTTPAPFGRWRNEAAVYFTDGQPPRRYAKLHPFSFGKETECFMAGDRLITFAWQGAVGAPLVCYDLRFPEPFRLATEAGVEVFVIVANWPTVRVEHWLALLRARAIENQACVIGVNRCGTDPKLAYPGRSVVVNPLGEILADAGDGERLLAAELNLEQLRAWRQEFPALRDRRTDYARLTVYPPQAGG